LVGETDGLAVVSLVSYVSSAPPRLKRTRL